VWLGYQIIIIIHYFSMKPGKERLAINVTAEIGKGVL
jgi:hypothetical protein